MLNGINRTLVIFFYITKSLRLYTVEVYSVRASVFIDHSITNMVCFSETVSVCVLATTE